MKQSYTLQFTRLRAASEAEFTKRDSYGIEFWFLGLLKLSELRAKDTFRLPEAELKKADADIETLRDMFKSRKIDTEYLRARLRHALNHGAESNPNNVDVYLSRAMEKARERGDDMILAGHLLQVLLEDPTDTLRRFLEG